MATLNLAGLSKTYFGGVRAVSDVSFDVDDGEFIVLVGPSGCGKSTILRMIAGLEAISEGTLTIGGERANDKEPGARDIAMVFQNYALYPHMSVRGNMAYGLKNEGLPKDQIAERIAEASRILQLEPYLDRKPKQLSGGQRQRVAMGRAIVRKPEVFLFDEPLSNLDAKLRTQLRHELKALHQRLGATFIYVTHDQVEAMSLADRIILMNGGQVEQIGTSMELYDQPASRFVAEFIGTPAMNILPGILGEDGRSVILAEGQGRIAMPARVDAEPGQALSIGLRPEHLRVDYTAPILRMTVRFIEQLGADAMVHGLVEGSGTEVTLRVDGTQHYDIGQTVPLASSAAHLHLFDGQSGKRVG